MTEAFVFTETDRTKSKWVAAAYHDFVKETGRIRTTLRGLFYYALQRKASDYPICGGFVGEIRITRPYHESDGEKLAKWAGKARTLGFIPSGALLDEPDGKVGVKIFLPETEGAAGSRREVWISKPSLNPLLYPVCEKHQAALVSLDGIASEEAIAALCQRSTSPTQILCLSDLSVRDAFFARDLAEAIRARDPEGRIEVRSLGLLPEQVLDLKIPMIRAGWESRQKNECKQRREEYRRYLQPFGLDWRGAAEIDALEAHYTGGIAAYLDEILSRDQ